VAILGAVSVITGTAMGAALAVGQSAASAATTTVALDAGGPVVIFQNVVGLSTAPGPVNQGNGYTITVADWASGDQIILETGTPNGGAGVECNTAIPAGVNQTTVDMSNYVFFSASDVDTGDIVVSGSDAPSVAITPVSDPYDATSGDYDAWPSDCDDQGSGYNELVLTLSGTPEFGGSATIYLGYSISFDGSPALTQALAYDTGFGAATGLVPIAGFYCPSADADYYGSASLSDCAAPASLGTVSSDADLVGETPSANSPSSGLDRITGYDTVATTPVSNFSIGEVGGFLFPANIDSGIPGALQSVTPNQGTGGVGAASDDDTSDAGAVCLVLDNSTHQNLEFASTPAWNVSPGASTSPDTASVGGLATVVNDGNILQLPVNSDNAAGTLTNWVASGISLATAPGETTDADGPVWASVYWISDYGDTLAEQQTLCADEDFNTRADPYSVDGGDITSPDYDQELGYVQLGTVSELANAIYGAAQVDTAAAAIGHQFDYATGQCIGSDLPHDFVNGGDIFLAQDGYWSDALGAAFPAGADDSAVALTDPNTLSSAAANIIREEGVSTVYLVGGPLAISSSIETTLASTPAYTCGGGSPRINILGTVQDLTVIRIAGQTADDTNELLATTPGAEFPMPVGAVGAFNTPTLFNDTTGTSGTAPAVPGNTALLVTDNSFQDAVSASGLAYYGPLPLITTTPDALSSDALEALYDNAITQVLIVGGPDAVSNAVVSQLSGLNISSLRIAGQDGSDTSTQLAAFELSNLVTTVNGVLTSVGLGLDNNDYNWGAWVARTPGTIGVDNGHIYAHTTLLARSDYYADALTASVLSVHNARYNFDDERFNPMILAESPGVLGTYATAFLNEAGTAVSTLPGAAAAGGWLNSHYGRTSLGYNLGFYSDYGNQNNDASSNVYTIQPIGGPLALNLTTLEAAQAAVTAG
jgi:putative cell wall-binding protein